MAKIKRYFLLTLLFGAILIGKTGNFSFAVAELSGIEFSKKALISTKSKLISDETNNLDIVVANWKRNYTGKAKNQPPVLFLDYLITDKITTLYLGFLSEKSGIRRIENPIKPMYCLNFYHVFW